MMMIKKKILFEDDNLQQKFHSRLDEELEPSAFSEEPELMVHFEGD